MSAALRLVGGSVRWRRAQADCESAWSGGLVKLLVVVGVSPTRELRAATATYLDMTVS